MSMLKFKLNRLKLKIKALPIAGRLAALVFQFFYARLVKRRYPGLPLQRRLVREALRLSMEYIHGAEVEGEVAEFGTMSGETAEALAEALVENAVNRNLAPRRLHLFDSFQGLPPFDSDIDRRCTQVQTGTWKQGMAFVVLNKEQLKAAVGAKIPLERVVVHDGWYKDTVPRIAAEVRFALLHVDCDLYSSTMEALGPLFQKSAVAQGAVILFDDWNTNRASPDFAQRKAWADLTRKHRIKFSDEGGYGWSGHKFIIHEYSA